MKKIFFIIPMLAIFLSGCEKEPNPIALFTLSNYYPEVGEMIFVTNNSVDAFSYSWNDGEGNPTNDFEPTLIYDSPGTYIVTLIASSESGALKYTSRSVCG
jgi:PKD repeat protein